MEAPAIHRMRVGAYLLLLLVLSLGYTGLCFSYIERCWSACREVISASGERRLSPNRVRWVNLRVFHQDHGLVLMVDAISSPRGVAPAGAANRWSLVRRDGEWRILEQGTLSPFAHRFLWHLTAAPNLWTRGLLLFLYLLGGVLLPIRAVASFFGSRRRTFVPAVHILLVVCAAVVLLFSLRSVLPFSLSVLLSTGFLVAVFLLYRRLFGMEGVVVPLAGFAASIALILASARVTALCFFP